MSLIDIITILSFLLALVEFLTKVHETIHNDKISKKSNHL